MLDAALEVFCRDGFFDARIQEITRVAGVAHGTFYTWFESKDAVFQAVMERIASDIFASDLLDLPAEGDPARGVERLLRRFFEAQSRHAAFSAVFDQVSTFDDTFRQRGLQLRSLFVGRLGDRLRVWQDRGWVDPSADPEGIAQALIAMAERLSYFHHVLKDNSDAEVLLTTMTLVAVRSLGLDGSSIHSPLRSSQSGG